MSKRYCIQLTLHSGQGIECFAKFTLGNDKEFAASLFRQLKGNRDVNEKDLVHMEFIELSDDLPLSIDLVACTLNDIGENSKIITRELFKSKLLSITVD